MAPFNKRQIGYIQAIAGRQQHRTLISGHLNDQLDSESSVNTWLKPAALDVSKCVGGVTGTNSASNTDDDAKSLLLHTFIFDAPELGYDSRAVHNDNALTPTDFTAVHSSALGMGPNTELPVFTAGVEGTHALGTQGLYNPDGSTKTVTNAAGASGELVRNPERISSTKRATEDGYLNSTSIKFRFTLPSNRTWVSANATAHPVHPLGQDHYEFRWIVWRHKKAGHVTGDDTGYDTSNMELIRDGVSFRNPGYDFFMGQTGRKRGLIGYTLNKDLDKDNIPADTDCECYSGKRWNGSGAFDNTDVPSHLQRERPETEGEFTVDDLLTMRINRDDYVVMKDVRFFLGKEHGKSHFEDTLHWDWNDPIETPHANVLTSPTLNGKNFRWKMTLIGTSGGKSKVVLNKSVRWTTKMESG